MNDMQITHAQAHQLIQFDLDQALDPEEQKSLFAHLEACAHCRDYAEQMKQVEHQLRHVMNSRWNEPPLPLSMDAIHTPGRALNLFPWRTALVSMVLVAFSFFIWQLTSPLDRAPVSSPSTIFPAPTPSTGLSTASLESPSCHWTLHTVDALDTLDRIALKYSVSKQEILRFNGMDSERIYESMEIKIPQCHVTPTMTARLPTTTRTPNLAPLIDTPG